MAASTVERLFHNHVPVLHPIERVSCRYCPIEEIASPEKLLKFFEKRQFTILPPIPSLPELILAKCTWEKECKTFPNTRTMHFYVLGDPSLFESSHQSPQSPLDTKMFLVTCPVWEARDLRTPRTMNIDENIYWTVNRNQPYRPVQLDHPLNDHFVFAQMVLNFCFTICNGVTIALAKHRLGIYSAKQLIQQLETIPSLISPFTAVWETIYMNANTNMSMVADLPMSYAMPSGDFDVIDYLKERSDTNYYGLLIAGPTHVTYTTPLMQMCPKSNLNTLKRVAKMMCEPEYIVTNSENSYVDFAAIAEMIGTASKKQWVWWKQEFMHIFPNLKIWDVLPALFYIYRFGVENGRLRKSRIRFLWKLQLDSLSPERRSIVSTALIENYSRHRDNREYERAIPPIPTPFLLDLQIPRSSPCWRTVMQMETEFPVYRGIMAKRATRYLLVFKHISKNIDHVVGNLLTNYVWENKQTLSQ